MSIFDSKRGAAFVAEKWQESILETLSEYIRVPNQSPMFDSEVLTNGYQDEAVKIIMDWITSQNVPNLTMRLETCEGRTPVIYAEVPSTIEGSTETILMYGHLDKQPPMLQGWEEGTGPYTPVVKDGKLYGRGGADDGYSAFAAITALKSVQEQGLQHARIVLLVEACEESGSKDLPYYIEKLKDDIGNPSLVVCLDSGCGNYDQLWMTATLRGMIFGILRVDVTQEGVHSGDASGTIPSSFRIMRDLLDRIEVSKTGELLPKSLHVEIPEKHYQYAKDAAETLDSAIVDDFPLLDNMSPVNDNYLECLLNKTWRPTLSYTGIDKIPHIKQAGNVLRPTTALGLSFRLPPTCEPEQAYLELKSILESNPPYGAKVSFESNKYSQGWIAPEMQPWLEEAVQKASQESFGKPALVWGEGFSIPFMDMLGKMFPETQFVITGVLGPKSNAHGPNEFMHIEMFHNITNSIASIIHSHYEAKVKV